MRAAWLLPALAFAVLAIFPAFPAVAQAAEAPPGVSLEATYKGDVIAYENGDDVWETDALDLLSIVADFDLSRVRPGLTARLHVENSSGGEPGADLGLARGFDNSEVPRQRLRLYEAWVEQSFAGDRASLLAGFHDFNSEFYATKSSGLFLAPGFGIGSELAGTGPGGPSIYPSTGLTIRGRADIGAGGYIQAAAVNALVGVPGDPGGADFSFDRGLLLAGEAGHSHGGLRLALGVWGYTEPANPAVSSDRSHGVYLLAERRLGGEGSPATAFIRAGMSDGRTTDFKGAFQAGVSVTPIVSGRPDSAFGIGIDHTVFSDAAIDARRAAGAGAAQGETGLEITYADRLGKRLLVQPDLQFVFDPDGDRNRPIVTILTVRFTVEF